MDIGEENRFILRAAFICAYNELNVAASIEDNTTQGEITILPNLKL